MDKRVEITEQDVAGNVTATYVESQVGGESRTTRVDMILPRVKKSLAEKVLDVFLPAGYPDSVTEDYIHYQIYDSLQAFSSSIAGLLSSRAVLSGIGVGDADSSATGALLLQIFQESAGRVATILFAHRLGPSLEPECKMYRLLADVLNDIAFVFDCLSPVLPRPMRIMVFAFASVLRALCGVAAGSSKASLSAHFARWGNLGELNAKDSSQETVISLFGMLVGSIVVTYVTTPVATWTTLIFLLSLHLETNRRAVRAVAMRTLSRQRANLVFSHIQRHNTVPTPKHISEQERIFERDGVLRDADDIIVGYCRIGVRMSEILAQLSATTLYTTGSRMLPATGLADLQADYKDELYMLQHNPISAPPTFHIVLKKGCTTVDQLHAWWTALALAQPDLPAMQKHPSGEGSKRSKGMQRSEDATKIAESVRCARECVENMLRQNLEALKQKGWDVETGALETRSGSRISFTAIE